MSKNDEENYEYENWEYDAKLYYAENWGELLKYRTKCYKNNPDDPNIIARLGEAYVLNKEYKKGLEFLKEVYKKYPDFVDIQFFILDCLFGLGKNENDFDWKEIPKIVRMNNQIIDECYKYLKNKRKPRNVYDIYSDLFLGDYNTFDEKDLLKEIKQDERFEIVDNSSSSPSAEIKLKKITTSES
ncbi:tetratricopeptide repeat protein [Natronospora cellulosivora (SeqCode)]